MVNKNRVDLMEAEINMSLATRTLHIFGRLLTQIGDLNCIDKFLVGNIIIEEKEAIKRKTLDFFERYTLSRKAGGLLPILMELHPTEEATLKKQL